MLYTLVADGALTGLIIAGAVYVVAAMGWKVVHSLHVKKLLLFAVALLCCTTLLSAKSRAVLTALPERFFWRLSGVDAAGNPSTVYIHGTIHVGTAALYPLAESVQTAWKSADRYVSELSSEDVAALDAAVTNAMLSTWQKDQQRLFKALSPDDITILQTALDADALNFYARFEPWVLNAALASLPLKANGYDDALGLDYYFYKQLELQGATSEGLDSLKQQLQLLSFGTYDEQIVLLKDSLATICNSDETASELASLYDAYYNNNSAMLTALIEKTNAADIAAHALYKRYYKQMYQERNERWAQALAGYLQAGGTTFVFAGCAHFVGSNSVFAYMKKAKTLK